MTTKQPQYRLRRDTSPRNKSWIVCVSTYPPRQCGIATFASDLTNAFDQMFGQSVSSKIVAINLTEVSHFTYPDKVIFQISQPRKEDYFKAAEELNRLKQVKLVSIQHEFGIFGGKYGSHLLTLLKNLRKPIVTTFHSVVPSPDEKMKTVVQMIMKYSQGIVVMTRPSKEVLIKDYGLDPDKIQVIPHGIHRVPYLPSDQAKSALRLAGQTTLSTFGFLSPGKGVEYVIEALPKVVKKFPNVRFLVAGVTHPAVLAREGETYRKHLTKRVKKLGLINHVLFYNTYFSLDKLLQFLRATDVYICPSLDPNQAVSGTLSYALGSGRPVISTAFSQAKQDISHEVGFLVGFKKPDDFAKAIIKLLGNNHVRMQMSKNAYFRTRHMIWENVALSYLKFFSQFVPELAQTQRRLPPIKLTQLINLTDDFGMIQFAKFTEPDISSGYTLDDNARAMIVATSHYKKYMAPSSLGLVSIYLDLISRVAKPDGYFDNYVSQNRLVDKERNISESSEDPSARALHALAFVSITKQIPKRLRQKAHSLFEQSFAKNITFSSPRSIAFYILALCSLLSKWKEPKTLATLRHYCEKLIALYEKNHSVDWEWFEQSLTYSNALLPHALLLGYKITGEKRYFQVSQKTLDFLITHTFEAGMYIPIGQSGWFRRGQIRQYFDQQPEDTTATIKALNVMFQITNNKQYKDLANIAFNWFLGNNLLGQVVYDRSTGGCYDGIGEKFINLNQGAESTISYLSARLSFEDQAD